MWICLNDAFLSIVSKSCKPDELLVRARRKGDIERVFPGVQVRESEHTDYRFRAVVKRELIAKALTDQVKQIAYSNFKDSVRNDSLHDAYSKVWAAMYRLQPKVRTSAFVNL